VPDHKHVEVVIASHWQGCMSPAQLSHILKTDVRGATARPCSDKSDRLYC
jgi:hypothetical protein